MIVFLDDCGAKIKIKLNFSKEVCFGNVQYRIIVVRFLMSQPVLLSFFLGYLASLFESGKPVVNIQLQKYDTSCMIRNSVYCSQLSLLLYRRMRDNIFINVNYVGCYYQNFFTELFALVLEDKRCGQLTINTLLEQLVTIYQQKVKESKNVEVINFFVIALLIEIKEFKTSRVFTQFKKSQIKGREEVLKATNDGDYSDDELGFKLMFTLLSRKMLSEFFEDRIKALIVRFEAGWDSNPQYLDNDYIQRQRIILMQLIYQIHNSSLKELCG